MISDRGEKRRDHLAHKGRVDNRRGQERVVVWTGFEQRRPEHHGAALLKGPKTDEPRGLDALFPGQQHVNRREHGVECRPQRDRIHECVAGRTADEIIPLCGDILIRRCDRN